ncbi:zf-HC2 domain-containing protein [Dactylosporangium sp. NPDC051541]|uniref:zf-HC2 domain-containing protein n=1 Tax=Dactylosporangium sp. NPDC051541 TaxID=3363977 RepID=UPI003789A52A
MSWHVDDRVWVAYAGGRLDPAAEASVEAHVTGCAQCRAAARGHAPAGTEETIWTAVRETITAPAPPVLVRLLRRLGVRDDDLVLLFTADSLLVPWAAAVGFAIACAILVGFAGLGPVNRDAVFLAMAPLAPVLAVVVSYDALDPIREVTAPTPYSKLRLALLRTAAALVVALPATAAIGLVVPGLNDLAFVWLAPSLGLTVGALVLLTWLEARVTGALVASLWVGTVVVVRTNDAVGALTVPVVQAAFAVAGFALAAVLILRTSTLRLQGGEQ